MPFVRISLLKGKPAAHVRAIADGVHQALTAAYNVPADDRFQVIHQHDRDELIYDPDYMAIHRTDDLVFIQITAASTRNTLTKQALFRAIAERLTVSPGLRPEDIMIFITPNSRDEWSFGHGVAQYAELDAANARRA